MPLPPNSLLMYDHAKNLMLLCKLFLFEAAFHFIVHYLSCNNDFLVFQILYAGKKCQVLMNFSSGVCIIAVTVTLACKYNSCNCMYQFVYY